MYNGADVPLFSEIRRSRGNSKSFPPGRIAGVHAVLEQVKMDEVKSYVEVFFSVHP